MHSLGDIEEGKVDLEGLSLGELGKAMAKAVRTNNVKVIKKLTPHLEEKSNNFGSSKPNSGDQARDLFANYIEKIEDPTLKQLLKEKRIRVIEHSISSVMPMGLESSKDIFKTGNTIEPGISNLDNAKLPQGTGFLVTGIRVMTGEHATLSTPEAGKTVDFGIANNLILNGFYTFVAGTETFVSKSSAQVFKTGANERVGFLQFKTPILITSGIPLSFVLDAAGALPDKTFVSVTLEGLITMKKG